MSRLPAILAICFSISSCSFQASSLADLEKTPSQDVKITQKSAVKKKNERSLKLAESFAKDGLFRESLKEFLQYLKLHPQDPSAMRGLGIVQVKVGQYQKAIENLSQAYSSFSNDYELNFYLAEAYRSEDKYQKAIFHYQSALYVKKDDISCLKALAWTYYQTRYFKASLDIARKLKNIAPDDLQVELILTRVLVESGNLLEAKKMLQRSLLLAKEDEKPYLRSVLGDVFFEEKNYPQAIEAYRLALREQPFLAGALLGMGKSMLLTGGDMNRAREFIKRALKLKPKMHESLYWLARSYENSTPEKAARFYALFERRTAADPAYSKEHEITKQRLSALKSDTKRAKREVREKDKF